MFFNLSLTTFVGIIMFTLPSPLLLEVPPPVELTVKIEREEPPGRVGEWFKDMITDNAMDAQRQFLSYKMSFISDPPADGDESLHGPTACSCIRTARAEGTAIPYGTNAEDLIPNSSPVIGGLVLFKYPEFYHVARILSITDIGYVVVEGNKTPCVREYRTVLFKDPFITGFWTAP